jgi:hypothetical protein
MIIPALLTRFSGLREFVADYPVARAYLVYGGSQRLRFGSIEVIPLEESMKNWLALIAPKNVEQPLL